jgi:hypothetical protein
MRRKQVYGIRTNGTIRRFSKNTENHKFWVPTIGVPCHMCHSATSDTICRFCEGSGKILNLPKQHNRIKKTRGNTVGHSVITCLECETHKCIHFEWQRLKCQKHIKDSVKEYIREYDIYE